MKFVRYFQKKISVCYLIVGVFTMLAHGEIYSQGCCSGGSANPISGGASTGVLQKNQVDFSLSHQYSYTDEFYSGDKDTINLIDQLTSNYLFVKLDYGVTEKFTISLATGYFFNKTSIELGYKDTVSSSGISDIIIFPRYSVFNKKRENSRTELTLGLGMKIPIGSNTAKHEIGEGVEVISPPTVQLTTGSQDLMLYGFLFQGYQKKKLRLFASTLFIKKSYNSMGQKFGDYASIGLFVGKTVLKSVGLTAQIKGEWIGRMKVAETVSEDDIVAYNIDVNASGSKKMFFVPQISYSYKNLSLFVSSDIPLYQYTNGVQPGSMYQVTAGLSYRFLTKKLDETPAKTLDLSH